MKSGICLAGPPWAPLDHDRARARHSIVHRITAQCETSWPGIIEGRAPPFHFRRSYHPRGQPSSGRFVSPSQPADRGSVVASRPTRTEVLFHVPEAIAIPAIHSVPGRRKPALLVPSSGSSTCPKLHHRPGHLLSATQRTFPPVAAITQRFTPGRRQPANPRARRSVSPIPATPVGSPRAEAITGPSARYWKPGLLPTVATATAPSCHRRRPAARHRSHPHRQRSVSAQGRRLYGSTINRLTVSIAII